MNARNKYTYRQQQENSGMRFWGAIKFTVGTLATMLAARYVQGEQHAGHTPAIFAMIIMASPGAYGLGGLIELVTGNRFTEVAEKWDSLEGWQRGVLGVVVVIVAFLLMLGAIVLFA